MSLRDYQRAAVSSAYDYLRAHKEGGENPVIVIPPGGGKSLVIAQIARDAVELWQSRVLVLAHRKELLSQNADKISRLSDVPCGLFSAGLGRRETEERIIVAGIQSAAPNADKLGAFDLVLIDEAHLVKLEESGQYRALLAGIKAKTPDCRAIGLTATPYRLNGGFICGPDFIFNDICYQISVADLVAQGYLSPAIQRDEAETQSFDFHVRRGEFVAAEVEAAMTEGEIVRRSVVNMVEQADKYGRKKVLVFAVSIAHIALIQDALAAMGRADFAAVSQAAPDRDTILNAFATRDDLRFLINCEILTTGYDFPAIDCVAIMRPTASKGLFMQMCGRAFRIAPGKENWLLLDYGGNIRRHGLVDEIDAERRDVKDEPKAIRKCPECGAAVGYKRKVCPGCGAEMPVVPRAIRIDCEADTPGASVAWAPVAPEAYYAEHRKNENAIPVMRVDYYADGVAGERYTEWLCPEHEIGSYPRTKFERWWNRHSGLTAREYSAIPATVAEAVERARAGELRPVEAIKVLTQPGEKWPRIMDYEFSPAPTNEMKTALRERLAEKPPLASLLFDECGRIKEDDEVPW